MTDDLRAALYACKRILTKLQLIDDAPTSRVRTHGQVVNRTDSDGLRTRDSHGLGVKSGQFSTSQIPEGVRLGGDLTNGNGGGGHAPSKNFSLWGHYHWRMTRAQQAQDASALLKLAACATRDWEIHTGKRTTNHTSHETAVIELLRDCTGMSDVEASWWLDAPLKWVRRHRVLNGRDAEMGEPTQKGSERTRRILAMSAGGMKQQAIADEVGLTRQRVQQILAGG